MSVSDLFDTSPKAAGDLSPGYADPSRMADLIAEPGLAMDVGMIALLMARVCLATLLHGAETTLPDLPTNWLLFGNRVEWIFKQPLESLFVDIPKRLDCPTCNYQNYVGQHIDMTVEEAAELARQILSELPDIKTSKRHQE